MSDAPAKLPMMKTMIARREGLPQVERVVRVSSVATTCAVFEIASLVPICGYARRNATR